MNLQHLRELLQALALGAVLTLQAFKVSANLSQLKLQLGVTTEMTTNMENFRLKLIFGKAVYFTDNN